MEPIYACVYNVRGMGAVGRRTIYKYVCSSLTNPSYFAIYVEWLYVFETGLGMDSSQGFVLGWWYVCMLHDETTTITTGFDV